MREWRDEVRGSTVLDDASIEALFRDEPVPEELAAVAGAVGASSLGGSPAGAAQCGAGRTDGHRRLR